jgi:hypothetical protein
MSKKRVLKEFLNYPLGSAEPVLARFAALPGALRRGTGPEQFVYIEGRRKNRVLLVAHADTYWNSEESGRKKSDHKLIFSNGIISSGTPGYGIGADDRAGCAILWLLKGLGHSLLITSGEEKGGLGSNWLMDFNGDIAYRINNNHQFAVQFDRRNSRDYKCYTVGTEDFSCYIEDETGYTMPDVFSYTDIVTLCHRITGVNLSIGYYNEHSANERLVVNEWLHTLEMAETWLNKPDLPLFLRGML